MKAVGMNGDKEQCAGRLCLGSMVTDGSFEFGRLE